MNTFKRFEDLSFSDDFMFCKILQSRPDYCERLISLILGRTVHIASDINQQKVIKIIDSGRGIRLDIYFEGDDETIYNLEMQTSRQKDLPLRARYYQSLMDLETLEQGEYFSELKSSYVIFLCRFDPFRRNQCRYTFRTFCEECPDLPLKDNTCKVFLNTKAATKAADPELRALLDYIDGRGASSSFTLELDDFVQAAHDKEEWKMIYLKQHSREETIRREAEAIGEKRGKKLGEKLAIESTARNMKADGMPPAVIAKYTGLTVEQIEAL